MRCLLLLVLLVGCKAPSEPKSDSQENIVTISPKPTNFVYLDECCFNCSAFKLVPISYGVRAAPGTVSYGSVELEWKNHCMACGKPTTGNLDRDFELRRQHANKSNGHNNQ